MKLLLRVFPGIACLLVACSSQISASPTALPFPSVTNTLFVTAAPTPVPPAHPSPSLTPAETETAFAFVDTVAFIRAGNLVIESVTSANHATHAVYELSSIENVGLLRWSPNNLTIAFDGDVDGRRHSFAISVNNGKIIDLGEGENPSWAPDSTRVVYGKDRRAVWLTNLETTGRQHLLTTETRWWWGAPVFTPDGKSVLAAGNSIDEMAPRGAGILKLVRFPLDGNGDPIVISEKVDVSRVPENVQFSPDGLHLAWVAEFPISGGCFAETGYYILNPSGTIKAHYSELPQSNLATTPEPDDIFVGHNYSWRPQGDKLAVAGHYTDCDGAKLSESRVYIIDVSARSVVMLPGDFDYPSYSSTGAVVAVQQETSKGSHILVVMESGTVIHDLGDGLHPSFAYADK